MSKHTPGPWSIDGGRVRTAIMAGNKHVAMVNWYNAVNEEQRVIGDEHEANASLIAAAPELLEALLECLECEFAVTDKAAIEKARAAIAKAKGEE